MCHITISQCHINKKVEQLYSVRLVDIISFQLLITNFLGFGELIVVVLYNHESKHAWGSFSDAHVAVECNVYMCFLFPLEPIS